ncbi:MAG: hypothetical protein HDKAJFGB_02026 [Anaerolineae bacterium]|nr:hypothetical protein [Anaerolineae bacterium]
MSAKGEKITIEFLHVQRHVRRALRGVNDRDRAHRARARHNGVERRNGAGYVGHHRDRDEFCFGRNDLVELVERELSLRVGGNVFQRRALRLREQLPRHNIRVMFEHRNHKLVAGANVLPSPSISNQIQRFGRVARPHDFAPRFRVDKFLNLFTRALVFFRRLFRKLIYAAMNVGVRRTIVRIERAQDGFRFLRSRRRVEINQRFAVNRLLQNGKILAEQRNVEGSHRNQCQGRKKTKQADKRRASWLPVCYFTIPTTNPGPPSYRGPINRAAASL